MNKTFNLGGTQTSSILFLAVSAIVLLLYYVHPYRKAVYQTAMYRVILRLSLFLQF